jgi:hypothetical protein
MQETRDKPNVSRRGCFPRFREGRLAAQPGRAEVGNGGDTCAGEDVPREVIVQNKANFSIADWGLRIADSGRTSGRPAVLRPPACAGRSRKTKPISGRPESMLSLRERASYGAFPLRAACRKQSQFLDCGLGTDFRWDACPAACGPESARVDGAKRSRFGPRARKWVRTAGAAEGEMCRTNPIRRGGEG